MESIPAVAGVLLIGFCLIYLAATLHKTIANPVDLLQRAKEATKLKKWDEAIDACSLSIKSKPSYEAFRLRGFSHFNKSEWELAALDYTSVIELGMDTSANYILRADCWCRLEKYEEALEDFGKAIHLDPNPFNYYKRGVTYFLSSNLPKALDDLGVAIADTQNKIAAEIQVRPAATALPFFLSYRANIFHKQGDIRSAIIDMDDAIKLKPSVEFYLKRGKYHQESGNQEAALLDYQNIVNLDSTVNADHLLFSPELLGLYEKGVELVNHKQWEDAIKVFSQIIETKINRSCISYRGHCYHMAEQWESALADFSTSIQLQPTNVFSYYKRALTHQQTKAWAKAADDLTMAIALTPLTDKMTAARYLSNRAYNFFRQERLDASIQDLNAAVRLNPNSRLYSQRGFFQYCKGEFSSALADRMQALRLDEDNDQANGGLAWMLATCEDARYRDGEKAVFHALKAHTKEPTKLAYIGTLAAAYAEAGNYQEAIKFAKMFLDSNPPEVNIEPARRRLALYQKGLPYREEKGKVETVEQ